MASPTTPQVPAWSDPPVSERGGSKRRKWLRYLLPILGVLALLALLGVLKGSQIAMLISFGEKAQAAGPPPEAVSAAPAELLDWEQTLTAVGSVASEQGLMLSNEVAGMVSRIHFDSGDTVQRGKVLLELDTRVERAQLGSLRAQRELAEMEVARSRALVAEGALSQQALDQIQSSFKSLSADVNALQAQIQRKVIRAPFSGRLGIRQVDVGQYLAPGTAITMFEAAGSFYVDFSLPQENLEQLKVGMPVRAHPAEPTPEAGARKAVEGSIFAIEPALNASTRAVGVRALLPNPGTELRPGMFARIEVVLPEQRQAVAVPLTAVVRAPYGDSLFLVETEAKEGGEQRLVARQQFVRLGQARGDFVAVLEGVTAGQQVVTSGAFKLRNGAPVVIDNAIKLDPKLNPRPENR